MYEIDCFAIAALDENGCTWKTIPLCSQSESNSMRLLALLLCENNGSDLLYWTHVACYVIGACVWVAYCLRPHFIPVIQLSRAVHDDDNIIA